MATALDAYSNLDPTKASLMSAYARRPSGPSASSYASSSAHYRTQQPALSTLEDSGNAHNRGLLQQSSSQRSGSSRTYRSHTNDSSTLAYTGAGGSQQNIQRMPSNSSLQRQSSGLSAQTRSSHNTSSEDHVAAPASANSDKVIEEKRKRANGDGFSIHRYTLGRMLGKGGFAKVYLCTAMDTGKNYAAKVVPKANLVKARARQKLQAEIKIHRGLKHRYVCQYKHYFEDRNNCYILLELCHNQSLNEMIKRRKRLTEPEAAYFMRQLLEATRYMHDENVIHRDLKLGNLFLDRDMNIKVGDLGLATQVETKDEKRKTICGTPNYIAPEIIQGDKSKRGHSFEVDVWSMGVILYTILIGKPPYEAKDVKATYQRILNNEYSFPRHTEISSASKSLIKSMLQSKPANRPTLDDIDAHPFIVNDSIPQFLPSSVLSIAPSWRVNEYGEMVCAEKQLDGKKPALPRSLARGRQPFAARDPNLRKGGTVGSTTSSSSAMSKPHKEERDPVNMERVVKSAYTTMMGVAPKKLVPSAFAIFDESKAVDSKLPALKSPPSEADTREEPPNARRHHQSPSNLTEDALCQQTRTLSLNARESRSVPGPPSALTQATESVATYNFENDNNVLQHMVEHLDTVISITESRRGTYRSVSLSPLPARLGPSQWVTRYVDYTSKYGLGFLLNDGSSGVYFNDSTKTALEHEGDTFQYIERKKVTEGDTTRSSTIVQSHSLEKYPESLKKKVTLLKHFRNYLLQQEMGDEEAPFVPQVVATDASSEPVYVKKWVRTKHAILFLLSSRTVQVIFYDQTEILLTPDVAMLTYVDKHRKRSTYDFNDELVGASGEIEKRLKYTKEIMHQLLPAAATQALSRC